MRHARDHDAQPRPPDAVRPLRQREVGEDRAVIRAHLERQRPQHADVHDSGLAHRLQLDERWRAPRGRVADAAAVGAAQSPRRAAERADAPRHRARPVAAAVDTFAREPGRAVLRRLRRRLHLRGRQRRGRPPARRAGTGGGRRLRLGRVGEQAHGGSWRGQCVLPPRRGVLPFGEHVQREEHVREVALERARRVRVRQQPLGEEPLEAKQGVALVLLLPAAAARRLDLEGDARRIGRVRHKRRTSARVKPHSLGPVPPASVLRHGSDRHSCPLKPNLTCQAVAQVGGVDLNRGEQQ